MRKAFFLAAMIALGSGSAFAEDITIKSLKIGMPKADVAALAAPFDWMKFPSGGPMDGTMVMEDRGDEGRLYGMTIGGVRAAANLTLLKFRSGRLTSVSFAFDAASYELVKAAVISKYPKSKCSMSAPDKNKGDDGDSQPFCMLTQGPARLYISKSYTTGFLLLSEILSATDRRKAASDI